MKLEVSYLTKNPCYQVGKIIRPKGLMLHSVGCNQPKASVFLESWNSPKYDRACVHGFIDGNTGTIYQTLPWTTRGWHCGGTANNTHIGVEMCEPSGIKYVSGSTFTIQKGQVDASRESARKTYNAAVELFAMLCKRFSLDPMGYNVILSHHEGHLRGLASNHGDPEHLWNGLNMGYTMDNFRMAVKNHMELQNGSTRVGEYLVHVKIDDLNVRTGPGTNYEPTGKFTGVGTFTIVETQGNWGLLKSYKDTRDGWICLSYTEKV